MNAELGLTTDQIVAGPPFSKTCLVNSMKSELKSRILKNDSYSPDRLMQELEKVNRVSGNAYIGNSDALVSLGVAVLNSNWCAVFRSTLLFRKDFYLS